jgi:hypothetical protein
MPEPQEIVAQSIELDPDNRRWLNARLIEYRELLAYLRDH